MTKPSNEIYSMFNPSRKNHVQALCSDYEARLSLKVRTGGVSSPCKIPCNFWNAWTKLLPFRVPHLQLKIPETYSYRNSLQIRHAQNFGNRNNVRGIPCLIWSVFHGDLRQNHGVLHGLIEANSNEYHKLKWEKDHPCYWNNDKYPFETPDSSATFYFLSIT